MPAARLAWRYEQRIHHTDSNGVWGLRPQEAFPFTAKPHAPHPAKPPKPPPGCTRINRANSPLK